MINQPNFGFSIYPNHFLPALRAKIKSAEQPKWARHWVEVAIFQLSTSNKCSSHQHLQFFFKFFTKKNERGINFGCIGLSRYCYREIWILRFELKSFWNEIFHLNFYWTNIGYVKFERAGYNWAQADAACKAAGMELVTFDDAAEYDQVQHWLGETTGIQRILIDYGEDSFRCLLDWIPWWPWSRWTSWLHTIPRGWTKQQDGKWSLYQVI